MTTDSPATANRVAVVTGAARGIGAGIAARLAADRRTVILVDILDDVAETADHLRTLHADVYSRITDVSDERAVANCIRSILDSHHTIDILINNAAISPKHGGVRAASHQINPEEWHRVLDINLSGAFHLSRSVLPCMAAARYGRIVNIASQAARTAASVAGLHYASAKSGMLGLTRTLALEYAADGVTVNAIAPGRIATPMMTAATEDINQRLAAGTPVGRVGTPADIAAAVAFLSSDEASFITGAVLDVNGGSFMG